ncbi:MAG TPA: hypothetical protein VHX86_16205 [Tepidisphaeraceae bacterium]|jgi:hypothetical protein|nr:hypothetical protein [Tepidisphaeraceae bacterium]
MNIRKLSGILDADRMAKMLGQLPPESQYVLSYYGTPAQWATRIGEALMRPAGKPAGFENLPPSAQIQWALQTIITPDSPAGKSGLVDRLTQLSTAAVEANRSETMKPHEKVQALIEEGTAAKAAIRGNEFNSNDLAKTSLDPKTLDQLTMDQRR